MPPRGPDKQPRRPRGTSPKEIRRREQDLMHAIEKLYVEAVHIGLASTAVALNAAHKMAGLEIESEYLG